MKILIVEDHPLMREVLDSVARQTFEDAAVDIADSCVEGLEKARTAETLDMVLLDLGSADCGGIDTLTRFRRAHAAASIVVFSDIEESSFAVAAIEGGARGFLSKKLTRPIISAALQLVAAGGVYVPPQALEVRRNGHPARPRGGLTARQHDVLRLIVKGLPNKEIAERLKIAEDTVKQHVRGVYGVLGVNSRTQAVSAAARRGLRVD